LRVCAFEVCLVDRCIWILILLTKNTRLVVERFREIDLPFSLIRFRKTVVNIRRRRITVNVRLERCNRLVRFAVKNKLVADLIDEVLRHRNRVTEFLAELCVMRVSTLQAADHGTALWISETLPALIDLAQPEVVTAQHH